LAATCASVVGVAGCGGDAEEPVGPRVDLIDDAIAAVEAHYGSPQEYFEISARLADVSMIVAVDDATAAEQGFFGADGVFVAPEPVGPASGSTFTAAAVDLQPDRIFVDLRDELDSPSIVDLVIQGGPDGAVIYDATVSSEAGGVLLVLLAADGTVLGVQAT
jgi:hypothetical protein